MTIIADDDAGTGGGRAPAGEPGRVVVGAVVTRAAEAALLAALQALRPEYDVRVGPGGKRSLSGLRRYDVSVRLPAAPSGHAIAVWLRVKSALMAQFPAGHPHAVTAIDPRPAA